MAEPAAAAATQQVDDERVRVTEWRLPTGAHTGWHRHEYDYVVVPVTDGELRVVDAEGEQRAALKLGQAYARRAGVEHDVFNAGPEELAFVEVEIKAHGIED
jgi:mannose-6-phosphate isomerase-like protein (cupin superfamily)